MSEVRRLRKRLTANDLGVTGSHQAGLHIPKSVAGFFPELNSEALNPDSWFAVEDGAGAAHRWRFIHYNNGVVANGTRDEFRVTYVREFLIGQLAKPGDVLELSALPDGRYAASVLGKGNEGDFLMLQTSGPWAIISYRRSRGR